MTNDTGVISFGGKQVAQIQIVENEEDGKRAQLYGINGIFLCEAPFKGDNDEGYDVGQALYYGYMAGQNNATISISRNITKALYEKTETYI